jgi:protein associated with RNAse G/E
MPDEVQVNYRKYDGSLHWHSRARRLGSDEYGTWLGGPTGSVWQRGVDGPLVEYAHAYVLLITKDVWWAASFNGQPKDTEIYCDITSVPQWPSHDLVTMIDLDLDVLRMRGGATLLVDEDEFAEHQVKYGYTPEVIARAEESARWLMAAVAGRTGPFGGAHEKWLALVEPDGGA